MSMLSTEELETLSAAESLFPSPIPVQSVSSDEFMPGPQTCKQREFEARARRGPRPSVSGDRARRPRSSAAPMRSRPARRCRHPSAP